MTKDKLETRKAELIQMRDGWAARIDELSRELQTAQTNLLVVRGALGEIDRLLSETEAPTVKQDEPAD